MIPLLSEQQNQDLSPIPIFVRIFTETSAR